MEEDKYKNAEITGVFVQLDDNEMISISALPIKDYEQFLELIHNLRLAYISMM